ncbi:hypothetical protein [Bradyrhizobium japonicum]|uniref:hypothetical protein n=1 Tax=Bradyrhizobium japonicum TaxID=375 RepID=UPI001E486874|nr:hypothetical protein [Bradyrhizobium japonicum]MCD9105266.1 hypothetical protein [Bradyrhizobium japonicum]MCS3976570.1 hypothetical protein [Bradyrhizobium japonicum]WRI68197.1 hypothetical protein RZE83_26825 [Bradyrhizobium japonicum]
MTPAAGRLFRQKQGGLIRLAEDGGGASDQGEAAGEIPEGDAVGMIRDVNQARCDHGKARLDKQQDAERRQDQAWLEQVERQGRGQRGEKTEQRQHGKTAPTMEHAARR